MNPRSLPFTVYPNKLKMMRLFLVSVAGTATGVIMIRNGEAMGWLCAGFFGLCISVFLIQLFTKGSFLTVSQDGLEIGTLFRRQTIRWSDVSEFGTYAIRSHGIPVRKMVGMNFAEGYQRSAKSRAVSQALCGYEGALPDTYGLRAEELSEMLSHYHREYASG